MVFGKILIVTALIAFVKTGSAVSVASFITKCKSDDEICGKQSAQAAVPVFSKGIPELKLEAMDPLKYETLDTSSKNLKLILSDILISGVKDCEITKMKRDVAKSKINLKALCTLRLDGQYEVGGTILIIPIEGKGKATVILNKLAINVDADIGDKVGKDGKKHWSIKGWKHTYELKEKAFIDLENLFQGNEILGRAAHDLLSSSPNEVISEVGPPIIQALLAKVVKTVNRFFHEVPVEDLSID